MKDALFIGIVSCIFFGLASYEEGRREGYRVGNFDCPDEVRVKIVDKRGQRVLCVYDSTPVYGSVGKTVAHARRVAGRVD